MDHRVSRSGLIISLIGAALAVATFLGLNQAFEGPNPLSALSNPYELHATFHDTEILPTKQPVLTRGVEVGKVTDVQFNKPDSTGTVTFSVGDELAPVYADATVAIGERTLLGDPYLNLDPGHESAGEMKSGGEVRALPSVDFDEALGFLDKPGRAHVRSILDTLSEGTRDPQGAEHLNATVAELSRTVRELHILTANLRGQEQELAGFVTNSSKLVATLGEHEDSIRSIVAAGRTALDALASNTESLDQGFAETPALLESARSALAQARPLLVEATPLVDKLRRAAPAITPAIADIAPLTGDVSKSISELATIPAMRKLLKTITLVGPIVPDIEAATRNLVTLLRYAAPRAKGLGAFFANVAGTFAHGDSDGRWVRFAILFEPGELDDTPTPAVCAPEDDIAVNAGFCHNAYPKPNDALDPEPYRAGSYPRLHAYKPPPP